MEIESVTYQAESITSFGYVAYNPKNNDKRPGVLIVPAWRGQDDFAKEKARQLAELGYIGFVADMYGKGLEVDSNERASELMLPLFLNRKVLRKRIVAAFEALIKHPRVDPDRICAIGFCFGGLTVIELLRSGSELQGYVTFHGLLGGTLGTQVAIPEPSAPTLHGKLLILHGHDDPLVSPEDISSIQKEFTDAGIQWEMDIYSHTSHAFTNPQSNDPQNGLVYQPVAAARAWQSLLNFLNEIFPL